MPRLSHALLAFSLLAGTVTAQLAGSYTINPLIPASPTNFPSLNAAVAALNAGGVAGPVVFDVYDDAGPYTETFPFTTNNGQFPPSTAGLMFGQWTGVSSTNRVTFRAGPGEAPVIDASANAFGVYWNGADYVTLEGFEIMNAPFDGISLYSESSVGQVMEAVITGCRIHHCGGSGVCIYGNSAQPVNTLVENCFLWHLQTTNSGAFNTTGRFGYVTTRRAMGTRIVNNTFFVDTGAGSSFCAIGSRTSGATEVTYADVRNNVFLKVAAAGMPIIRYNTVSTAVAPLPPIQDGNCYWELTASPLALYGTGAGNVAQTLMAWQQAVGLDAASLSADPMLFNPVGGDLHLQVRSPCIGMGLAAGTTVDIDGQMRVGRVDIGADHASAATLSAVGVGCAGTGGITPELYSREWPFLGNSEFAVLVRDAPPGAVVLGFISFGLGTPMPVGGGCSAYLHLPSTTTIPGFQTAGPAGTTGRLIPLPGNSALVGVQVGLQDMVLDSGAATGFTVTNALSLQLAF